MGMTWNWKTYKRATQQWKMFIIIELLVSITSATNCEIVRARHIIRRSTYFVVLSGCVLCVRVRGTVCCSKIVLFAVAGIPSHRMLLASPTTTNTTSVMRHSDFGRLFLASLHWNFTTRVENQDSPLPLYILYIVWIVKLCVSPQIRSFVDSITIIPSHETATVACVKNESVLPHCVHCKPIQ